MNDFVTNGFPGLNNMNGGSNDYFSTIWQMLRSQLPQSSSGGQPPPPGSIMQFPPPGNPGVTGGGMATPPHIIQGQGQMPTTGTSGPPPQTWMTNGPGGGMAGTDHGNGPYSPLIDAIMRQRMGTSSGGGFATGGPILGGPGMVGQRRPMPIGQGLSGFFNPGLRNFL